MKSAKHVTFSLLVFLLFTTNGVAQSYPPRAAIASGAPEATEAGFAMLEKGGNAFDAAIAVASVLAVVEPYASGLGGGGFWLLQSSKEDHPIFLDAREVAPSSARKTMYAKNPKDSLDGPLSAAIPGEPAALVFLAQRYGKLPLSISLAPAITLAEQGFTVDKFFQQRVRQRLIALRASSAAAQIFLDKDEVPLLGHKIIQRDLANTLRSIANQGMAGFYDGVVAKNLVSRINAAGGIWTLEDLKRYQLVIRTPLIVHYPHMTLTTTGLPSGGGVSVVSMLNMLNHFQWKSLSPLYLIQLNVELMRRAFWDRAKYLGDPAFVDVPLTWLLSKEHIQKLVSTIVKGKATSSTQLREKIQEGPNTTHYSILDKEGNRVAATLSINYYFGSGYVVPGTGILLNDEMDDFSTEVGIPNAYGLIPSEANSIAPGKRPLSSMAPAFLDTPTKTAILGVPGGSYIPTMMLLAIEDFLQGHLPRSWVSLKRYHHQYRPDEIQHELGTFSKQQMKDLHRMGYTLKVLNHPYGDMQAILWDKSRQQVFVASDPRRKGKALSK